MLIDFFKHKLPTLSLLVTSFLCFVVWSNNLSAKEFSTTLIKPENLALVVNDADQSSINVADYYREVHDIPATNVIHLNIPNPQASVTAAAFETIKQHILEQLLPIHTGVLFVWSAPYKVECNAITAAFTLGFNPSICKNTCGITKQSPIFNNPSKNLFTESNLRLSMLLPTDELEVAMKVIDNGKLSQSGAFKAKAYYLVTSDKLRNSRARYFPKDKIAFEGTGLSVVNMQSNGLRNVHDIMIYQLGAVSVKWLETLNFLPGALADHLTSTGGVLYGGSQMSVISWLRAGATASYGTVSEPCNHWQKFPNSTALLKWYVLGATALEAYWKSVAWPSQGLFVGDPLAAPYAH